MVVELKPRIVVVGVGGAGGNAVNNMIESNLQGVDFIVANTDSQALLNSRADTHIQLGANTTQGLGAGAKPEVGAASANESMEEIERCLDGAHLVFVAAGMGGGTGTGAAPVIARAAKAKGILTVGVITKPFDFEGRRRMTIADGGVSELRDAVDTLIIIPNQNLFRIANANTTLSEAFNLADEVLHAGVRGITDLMVMPGLINLDFADVQTVMSEMGAAMMGTGEADGEGRASKAARSAISNPLLDDISMKGAKGVLINITGGDDMTLHEVDEAANLIREEVDPDAQIILGSAFNPNMAGSIRVSVVATGISGGIYTQSGDTSAKTVEAKAQTAVSAAVVEPDPVALPPQDDLSADEAEPAMTAPVEPAAPPFEHPVEEPIATSVETVQDAVSFGEPEPVQRPKITTRSTLEENWDTAPVDEPSADFIAESPMSPVTGIEPEPTPPESPTDKGGFSGLFGWRRGAGNDPAQEEAAKAGDDYAEDDLEIPAFLRRSASS